MLRESLSTSSFSVLMLLNARELTAHEFELRRATCKPGTPRSASGIVVAPERRMSSLVTTLIAAAAELSVSAVRDTDVTSMSISSSMLRRFSAVDAVMSCDAAACPLGHNNSAVASAEGASASGILRMTYPFESVSAVISASAADNSASFGGLLNSRSTCSGTVCSVLRRWPQPVSSRIGVRGDIDLMAAATARPST